MNQIGVYQSIYLSIAVILQTYGGERMIDGFKRGHQEYGRITYGWLS